MMIFPAVIITVKATINCPLEGENNLSCKARERLSDSGEGVGGAAGKDIESTLFVTGPVFFRSSPPARDPPPPHSCVPADGARLQAAALVRGNRFTAGSTTGSYLHKLAEKHLPAGYSIVSLFFLLCPYVSAKKSWPSLRVKS